MSRRLASVSSEYQLLTQVFTLAANTWTQIVSPDPRRWYLQIAPDINCGGAVFVSGTLPDNIGATSFTVFGLPVEFKFKDRPASTTSEQWIKVAAVGNVVVTQELWIRD